MATPMIIYIRSLLDIHPVVRKLTVAVVRVRDVVNRRLPLLPTKIIARRIDGNNVPKN